MAGRPKKKVDEKLISSLAGIGCTVSEIAEVCEVSKDTLERNFAASIKRGREIAKASLRRMQWKSAQAGNVTMQIWLGKQMLGQKDNPDVHVSSVEFGLGELPEELTKRGPDRIN